MNFVTFSPLYMVIDEEKTSGKNGINCKSVQKKSIRRNSFSLSIFYLCSFVRPPARSFDSILNIHKFFAVNTKKINRIDVYGCVFHLHEKELYKWTQSEKKHFDFCIMWAALLWCESIPIHFNIFFVYLYTCAAHQASILHFMRTWFGYLADKLSREI